MLILNNKKNIKAIKAALLTYFNDSKNKEMIFRMFRKKKEIMGKSYKIIKIIIKSLIK